MTPPQLVQLFEALISGTEEDIIKITFSGASPGRSLALAMTLGALRKILEMISLEGLMLIAPVVDLRFTNYRLEGNQNPGD